LPNNSQKSKSFFRTNITTVGLSKPVSRQSEYCYLTFKLAKRNDSSGTRKLTSHTKNCTNGC